MKKKKVSFNLFYVAFFIEVVLAYVLPFRITDGVKAVVGFPIPFITIHNAKELGFNPMMSMQLNPLSLLINVLIIYIVIYFIKTAYKKYKSNKKKERVDE